MDNVTKDTDLKMRITAEAARLFMKYGLKSIRMDDIATRMNISKRTLYEIFGDRENLILNSVEYFFNEQREKNMFIAKKAGNVIERFILVLGEWDMAGSANMMLMSDLRRFYPAVHEKVFTRHYEEGIAHLREQLEDGVREGIFMPGLNVELAAYMLSGSVSSLFVNPSFYRHNNISEPEAFKYIMICFIRGISTNKGMRLLDAMSRTINEQIMNVKVGSSKQKI